MKRAKAETSCAGKLRLNRDLGVVEGFHSGGFPDSKAETEASCPGNSCRVRRGRLKLVAISPR